jgi:hypothetical protein
LSGLKRYPWKKPAKREHQTADIVPVFGMTNVCGEFQCGVSVQYSVECLHLHYEGLIISPLMMTTETVSGTSDTNSILSYSSSKNNLLE